METTDVNSAGNNGNDNTDETHRPSKDLKVYVGHRERYRRDAPTIYRPPYEAVRSVEPGIG